MGRSVYVAQKKKQQWTTGMVPLYVPSFLLSACRLIGKFTSGSTCVANSLKRFTSTSSRIFSTVNGKNWIDKWLGGGRMLLDLETAPNSFSWSFRRGKLPITHGKMQPSNAKRRGEGISVHTNGCPGGGKGGGNWRKTRIYERFRRETGRKIIN